MLDITLAKCSAQLTALQVSHYSLIGKKPRTIRTHLFEAKPSGDLYHFKFETKTPNVSFKEALERDLLGLWNWKLEEEIKRFSRVTSPTCLGLIPAASP